MNKYHDIKEIKFIGDVLEATIDGTPKRFRLKDVSPLLEKATEIERKTLQRNLQLSQFSFPMRQIGAGSAGDILLCGRARSCDSAGMNPAPEDIQRGQANSA